MKTTGFKPVLFFVSAASLALFIFTGCEKKDYDLIDPDSAGVWTEFNSTNSGLPGDKVYDLEVDRTGDLWISCFGNGLAKYSDGTWTKFNTTNSGLISNNVTAIETTYDGTLVVGTTNGIAMRSPTGQWSSYTDPLVTAMDVNSVRSSSDGSVWIGTSNEGFYIKDATNIVHSPSGFTVYAFEEDRSGNFWMGTSSGLLRWDGAAWTNISITEGLPAGSVSAIYNDSKRRLWFSIIDSDKVYWLDNAGVHTLSLLTGPTWSVIWDICEDKKGDIWFATDNAGVVRYDGVVPHSYKDYSSPVSVRFPENKVNCLVSDNDGNMWFGLSSKGLVKYTLPLN
jgi:ligand-binding sensor domain-containing protein